MSLRVKGIVILHKKVMNLIALNKGLIAQSQEGISF